jgi:molybdopterin converting factor small subunit
VRVRIPTPLRSYTAEASVVESSGTTIDDVLRDLDDRFPGLRFRVVDEQDHIRPHMKIFVNDTSIRSLAHPVAEVDEITLMQALSGG